MEPGCRSQGTQYPLIKEYIYIYISYIIGFLKGIYKGLYEGSMRKLRNIYLKLYRGPRPQYDYDLRVYSLIKGINLKL